MHDRGGPCRVWDNGWEMGWAVSDRGWWLQNRGGPYRVGHSGWDIEVDHIR